MSRSVDVQPRHATHHTGSCQNVLLPPYHESSSESESEDQGFYEDELHSRHQIKSLTISGLTNHIIPVEGKWQRQKMMNRQDISTQKRVEREWWSRQFPECRMPPPSPPRVSKVDASTQYEWRMKKKYTQTPPDIPVLVDTTDNGVQVNVEQTTNVTQTLIIKYHDQANQTTGPETVNAGVQHEPKTKDKSVGVVPPPTRQRDVGTQYNCTCNIYQSCSYCINMNSAKSNSYSKKCVKCYADARYTGNCYGCKQTSAFSRAGIKCNGYCMNGYVKCNGQCMKGTRCLTKSACMGQSSGMRFYTGVINTGSLKDAQTILVDKMNQNHFARNDTNGNCSYINNGVPSRQASKAKGYDLLDFQPGETHIVTLA